MKARARLADGSQVGRGPDAQQRKLLAARVSQMVRIGARREPVLLHALQVEEVAPARQPPHLGQPRLLGQATDPGELACAEQHQRAEREEVAEVHLRVLEVPAQRFRVAARARLGRGAEVSARRLDQHEEDPPVPDQEEHPLEHPPGAHVHELDVGQ
eukprot:5623722-Heterocapsa_arctica.AAC.1